MAEPTQSSSTSDSASKVSSNEQRLVELARNAVSSLTMTEEQLVCHIARGEPFEPQSEGESKSDPAKPDHWGDDCTIRAEVLNFICLDKTAREFVTHRGIFAKRLHIIGTLDLIDAHVPFKLAFFSCRFDKSIELRDACVDGVDLGGSYVPGILADRLRLRGPLYLCANEYHRFVSGGIVRLGCASIEGDLVCVGGEFSNASDGNAIIADGIKVEGNVLLRGDGNNRFMSKGSVRLCSATIGGNLECDGGNFSGSLDGDSLNANRISVEGSIYLRADNNHRFETNATVSLLGASIGRDLDLSGGMFAKASGYTINADGITVSGSVFLRADKNHFFESVGTVRLVNGNVGGNVECIGGKFKDGKEDRALHADRINIRGSLYLSADENFRFESNGTMRLLGATIGGDLVCAGGKFVQGSDGNALHADGINVIGSVFLNSDGDNRFESHGAVRLVSATIGRNLECNGGKFARNRDGNTLVADRINVRGNVFLTLKKDHCFESDGTVRLLGATVGGNVDCTGAKLSKGRDGDTLLADGIKVNGSIFLSAAGNRRFESNGTVRLLGAFIGINIECMGGKFAQGESGNALDADGIKVGGSVFLREGCEFNGTVVFVASTIERLLVWHGLVKPENAKLDLRMARVGTLWDQIRSWPTNQNLWLDHFTYDHIHHDAPSDSVKRLDWIRRQHAEHNQPFNPQPYEHLATVLKRAGHDYDARQILINKERDRAERYKDTTSRTGKIWHGLIDYTIAFGYEPWKVWKGMLAFFAFGAFFFWVSSMGGCMVPTSDRAFHRVNDSPTTLRAEYPTFNPFSYSLDELLPIINLRQGDFWLPNMNDDIAAMEGISGVAIRGIVSLLRIYLWIHILAGWLLTTLFVAGVTGLIRK